MARHPELHRRLAWLTEESASGGIRAFYLESRLVRCGKTLCRCAQGRLHGPFYYLRFREALGRRHRIYVPQAAVTRVRRRIEDCRERRTTMRLALTLVQRLYGS